MSRLSQMWSIVLCAFMVGCGQEAVSVPSTDHVATDSEQEESRWLVGESLLPGSRGPARCFRFHYRFEVADLEPGQRVRVWLPVPQSGAYQQITALPYELPAEPTFHTEPKYGNRILYLDTVVPEEGKLRLDVPYRVERREVVALESAEQGGANREMTELQRELFLEPNARVPIDGKPLDLLSGVQLSSDAFELARQLYRIVDQHVAYDKEGSGWGNGDVLWVCDSRRGNCTDFHSLFISLARSQGVPSRFEIGFQIPTDAEQGAVGGYHCWAFFFVPSRGWVPVDISEADKHPSMKEYYFGSLTSDRVTFSVGRDIELVPKSEQGPLNYFIYPHVVVDGVPVPWEQIALEFSYANLEAEPTVE